MTSIRTGSWQIRVIMALMVGLARCRMWWRRRHSDQRSRNRDHWGGQ